MVWKEKRWSRYYLLFRGGLDGTGIGAEERDYTEVTLVFNDPEWI